MPCPKPETLRAWANHPASSGTCPVYPATLEAIADEIERLTAEVAEARACVNDHAESARRSEAEVAGLKEQLALAEQSLEHIQSGDREEDLLYQLQEDKKTIDGLKEQLAAREAKCSGCFECENDHFSALREHEARLLEEMAQKFIGRLQKPWTAVEVSDFLQREAAARRTK